MNIIGPDNLLFGVDDVGACSRYLIDYGLDPVDVTMRGGALLQPLHLTVRGDTLFVDMRPGREDDRRE
jgi:hypothetical protein